tara:strand:- start:85 stop:321 length:237 start_codon:yes stop_codon:yes gene_type:complete
MKLYRINTGEGYHYARNKKHLARAIDYIDENYMPREALTISVVEFEISRDGILSALWEGVDAAGGHEHGSLRLFGDED